MVRMGSSTSRGTIICLRWQSALCRESRLACGDPGVTGCALVKAGFPLS